MSINFHSEHILGDPLKHFELEHNIKAFTNGENAGAKRVYRDTLLISDGISKFLILYGLLLMLAEKGRQAEVDKIILKHFPTIEMVKGRDRMETKITRTRNIIGHPEDIDIKEIFNLVSQNIEPLRKVVAATLIDGV
jgi:hypothetical protein